MNKQRSLILTILFIACSVTAFTQDDYTDGKEKPYVYETFKTTRIINHQSVETLRKKYLDFRIVHRFGDIFDENSNVAHTLFGLDQAADIAITFEYGITNDLMIGAGRAKGAGPVRELWHGVLKYRLLRQTTDGKTPISIALHGNAAVSGMQSSEVASSPASFGGFDQRLSYLAEALIAKQFGERLSLQLNTSFLHRNYVEFGDENSLFFTGLGARIGITKNVAIQLEGALPFSQFRLDDDYRNTLIEPAPYFLPVSIGLEFETKGHTFHLNFTNAPSILANDYIPYNTRDWLEGQFRFGFSISREFRVGR